MATSTDFPLEGLTGRPIDYEDATWILTSAFIVFTMQSGFGLIESGSVAEQVRLVNSLLYGTRTKPVCFEFASFHHQIYAAFYYFFGNGPYGKTCTK